MTKTKKKPQLNPKQKSFVIEYLVDKNATQAAIRAGYSFCSTPIQYYAYLLVNSLNGEIFYVGKGKGNRMYSHLKTFKNVNECNHKKSLKINEIIKQGGEVVCLIFENNLSESEALEIEKGVILAIGLDNLTNISPGSRSFEQRIKERVEFSLNSISPFSEWLKLKVWNKNDIDLYWRIVNEFKKIAQCIDDCKTRGIKNAC